MARQIKRIYGSVYRKLALTCLLLVLGCSNNYNNQVTVVPKENDHKEVVLVFSEDLLWTKEYAISMAKERFNNPVIVIANNDKNNKEWTAVPQKDKPISVEELSLIMYVNFPRRDIVLFINNPNNSSLLTPRSWYFNGNVWSETGPKVSIWDSVTQQGYK